MTDFWRLGLIGDPVSHSRSPAMQNAALRAAGLHGSYDAHRTNAGELAARLNELAAAGYAGLNVTVPLKTEAFACLAGDAASAARLSPVAKCLGAVNTLRMRDGVWEGHNSDCEGFILAAREFAGALCGKRVHVLGAGGAARAVIMALLDASVAHIEIWNRSAERLAESMELFRSPQDEKRVNASSRWGEYCERGMDLIVQATSLGMSPDDPLPPLPAAGERPFAMDLVSDETAWQRACIAAACHVSDGRRMLLWQGASAFEYWTGIPAPASEMASALGL